MKQILIASLFTLITVSASGGSLTPPAAPGPTMKTLVEVEPRTAINAADIPYFLNKPGSYYLASSVRIPVALSAAVSITTSNVTLDLNGFTLEGPGTGSNVNGINVSPNVTGVLIKNGTVLNWPGIGILANGRADLENVTSSGNTGGGFYLLSGNLTRCTADSNGQHGISYYADPQPRMNHIRNCISIKNGQNGINIGSPAIITDSTVSGNTGAGIVASGGGSTVRSNTCSNNGQDGISAIGNYVVVESNLCVGNGASGIWCDTGRVENNEAVANSVRGYQVGSGCFAAKNVSRQNPVHYLFQGTAVYGPVVNMAAGGQITSEHPWANFSY